MKFFQNWAGEDGTSKKIQHVFPYKYRNHIFKDGTRLMKINLLEL